MRWSFVISLMPAMTAVCGSGRSAGAEPLFEETAVFVAGEDNIREYRIPALVTTNKGTLLAACDARVDKRGDAPNNIDQVLKRSPDNGKTWGPLQVVADYPGTEAGADPSLLVDRQTGVIRLFYAHAPEGIGTAKTQPGLTGPTFQYHLITSDDDGNSWSSPRDITPMVKDPTWNAFWPGPGRGFQTRSGRLLVPSSRWQAGEGCYSYIIYSDDHGQTWRITGPAGSNTNESQVVELEDGSLMMNMRSNHRKGRRAISISEDSGKTWSPLAHDGTLIEPVCQASFIRYTDRRDGHAKNRLLFSNPAAGRRRNMTVRVSYDEGKTWPVSKAIHTGPSAYSCLTVLADGTIGLLYERGKKTAYESITFARFNLEWLTNGKDRLEK